jgi:hypothetical protein
MKRSAGWLLTAAFLFVIALFIVTVWQPNHYLHPGEPYKENVIQAAVGVATALFVVAVFLERSLAVVNALLFGDEHREAALMQSSADEMVAAAATEKLAHVMGKKERVRLLVGFIAGLLISAAGIRTLAGLVSNTDHADWLFEPMDVLLTAGLLAGGSNGLALLIQIFTDRLGDSAATPESRVNARVTTT